MNTIATITSKKQLTLPSKVFEKAGLKIGQRVIVTEENGKLIITPTEKLVKELTGSLDVPKKWKGKTTRQIIEKAKLEYFSKTSR